MKVNWSIRRLSWVAFLPAIALAQRTVTTPGGTVNVVPKYSGVATIINSAIFESGGKVGIGTTSPLSTLSVNGGLTSTSTSILGNAIRFYSGDSDGNNSYGDIRTNPSTGNTIISARTNRLYFNYDHGTGGVLFGNGASGVVATISVSGNATFSGTGSSSFAGNLGVGTTSPSSKLTVVGIIQSTTGGFKFPDGSTQTTATLRGPQGPPGPSGASGPEGSPGIGIATPGGPSAGNTAVGINALQGNTTGTHNTATGYGALEGNTTGSENAAFGRWALLNNTSGGGNTAIGSNALQGNTTGNYNTAFGDAALTSNQEGTYNIAIGGALYSNVSGSNNVAIGSGAMQQNVTSSAMLPLAIAH